MNVIIQVMGELCLKRSFKDMPAEKTPFPSLPQPEPLLRQRSLGQPVPIEHLGPLRAPAEAIAILSQAPPEIGFQSLLAVAALETQAHADVELIHGGRAPLSLFFLTVASSVERKSHCDKLATQSLRMWEEKRWEEYRSDRQAFEAEHEIYESLRRKYIRDRCGDEVIAGAAPTPPQAPVIPSKLLSDITYEGLLHHFEEGDPSVGIFSDEGGQLFGGHAMNRENELKTGAGLSKIWDAAPLNRTRAGQPLTTFRHRRGSLHIMLQDRVADGLFANETLRDQGFLSRCLIAWPESRIGTRFFNESEAGQLARDQAITTLAEFHASIMHLLAKSAPKGANSQELSPPLLRLEPDTRSLLIKFANEVERQQAEGGNLEHIRGFASKAAEQAARIAGVMTLLRDDKASAVTTAIMVDAIAIMSWYLSEAQRILDSGYVDPTLQQADDLRIWLQKTKANTPFDKRTIVRLGPRFVRDTKVATRLLEVLANHNQIIDCSGAEIDGRKVKQAWRVRLDV